MKKKILNIIGTHVLLILFIAVTTSNCYNKNSKYKDSGQYDSLLVYALEEAKENWVELDKVLQYYKDKDKQKYEAACFLIRNMPGKCYTNHGWKNSEGKIIEFDALDYKNYEEAIVVFDSLEKVHGEISYKPVEIIYDIEVITADFLINNIEEAFNSWKNSIWTNNMPFDVFCERVLPYRGSNEPLDSTWRSKILSLFPAIQDSFPNPNDLHKVQIFFNKKMNEFVKFTTLYYLHPTDQSFSDMMKTGMGRCEDMSNMTGFLNKAFALPMANDYTPYWPKSDNNHAWSVYLDFNGKPIKYAGNHAAKIYRKNYSLNRDNLIYRVNGDKERIPGWLASNTYSDVTSEYHEVSNVVIKPDLSKVVNQDYIYICVFNGGAWREIHWAEIKDKQAIFTDMGLDICYIAAAYIDKELVPVSHPFILTKNKELIFLDGSSNKPKTFQINAISSKLRNVDTGDEKKYMLEKGTYFFYTWEDNKWQEKQHFVLEEKGIISVPVNDNTLYWITTEDKKNKARIFTINDGVQVWW